jgi:hypothetical protein
VAVSSGVAVGAMKPTKVGVGVKVGVGETGVDVERGVAVPVGVGWGGGASCPGKQAESRNKIKKMGRKRFMV